MKPVILQLMSGVLIIISGSVTLASSNSKGTLTTGVGQTSNAVYTPSAVPGYLYNLSADYSLSREITDDWWLSPTIEGSMTDFFQKDIADNARRSSMAVSLGSQYFTRAQEFYSLLSVNDSKSRTLNFIPNSSDGLPFNSIQTLIEIGDRINLTEKFLLDLSLQRMEQNFSTLSVDELSNRFEDDHTITGLSARFEYAIDKVNTSFFRYLMTQKNFLQRAARFSEGTPSTNNSNPKLTEAYQQLEIGHKIKDEAFESEFAISYGNVVDQVFQANTGRSFGAREKVKYQLTRQVELSQFFNFEEKDFSFFVADFLTNPASRGLRKDRLRSLGFEARYKINPLVALSAQISATEMDTNFVLIKYMERRSMFNVEWTL